MADITNLSQFLTDVADAIRIKRETTDAIPAENFDSEILQIETGTSGEVPVKLFDTVEEMQADTSMEQNDLALVYTDAKRYIEPGEKVETIYFPEVVTFDTAITENETAQIMAEGASVLSYPRCALMVTTTYARVTYYVTKSSSTIVAEYTTTDAMTYTKTSTNESYTIPTDLYASSSFGGSASLFAMVSALSFNGLYKCDQYVDETSVAGILNYTDSTTYETEIINISELLPLLKNIPDVVNSTLNLTLSSSNHYFIQKTSDTIFELYTIGILNTAGTFGNTFPTVGLRQRDNVFYLTVKPSHSATITIVDDLTTLSTDTGKVGVYKLSIDISMETILVTQLTSDLFTSIDWTDDAGNVYTKPCLTNAFDMTKPFFNATIKYTNVEKPIYTLDATQIATDIGVTPITTSYITRLKYFYAPTQLTIAQPNQLLNDVIAYGPNGVITGDGTIYNNLDNDILMEMIFSNISELPSITFSYSARRPANDGKVRRFTLDKTKQSEYTIIGNTLNSCQKVNGNSIWHNNMAYDVLPSGTLRTWDFNTCEYTETTLTGDILSDYTILHTPMSSYLDRETMDMYTFASSSADDSTVICKASNGVLSQVCSVAIYVNQAQTFQFLGIDHSENALYYSITGWYNTTVEKGLHKVVDGVDTLIKSFTYEYGYSRAWETTNYLGLSIGSDGPNEINYKRKGDDTWYTIDISSYGQKLAGQSSGSFELTTGNLLLNLGTDSIEIDPTTNTIVTIHEGVDCICYKDILSEDEEYLYTCQNRYTKDGLFDTEIIKNNDNKLGRLDLDTLYLVNLSSNNLAFVEGFIVTADTDFTTNGDLLGVSYAGEYKQLTDYNFDTLRPEVTDYTGTITPEEYDVALQTAQEIEGGTE